MRSFVCVALQLRYVIFIMNSDMHESTVESEQEQRGRQGVRSVETGAVLLRRMAAFRRPVTLKELADTAGMAPAKAHRYLVSLIRAGLVEQEPGTGQYRLGQLSLELGLAALGELDVMRFAAEALGDLREAIDETVLIAVWGNHGPVVVRWEESSRPVTTNVRVGSVMPLLNSATGRAFAAFMPEGAVTPLLGEERDRNPALAEGYDEVLAECRRHGLGRVDGDLLPGVASLAVPVFDYQGEVAAVIAALGHQGVFDSRWDGPIAEALREAGANLSARLGHVKTPAA